MPVIAIAGQKGGTGKSTLAVNIASELAARGRRVLLVDADPQATALPWASFASEQGHEGPTTIAMGDNLRAQLPQAAKGFEWTVIDLPGRVSKRQGLLRMAADPLRQRRARRWAFPIRDRPSCHRCRHLWSCAKIILHRIEDPGP